MLRRQLAVCSPGQPGPAHVRLRVLPASPASNTQESNSQSAYHPTAPPYQYPCPAHLNCPPVPPSAPDPFPHLHTSGSTSSHTSTCCKSNQEHIKQHVMLQHIHEHSCPACHICHPMPPPASNTSKAGLPEIGLRLQDGRQKQPPIAFPHLHSIRRPSESPSPASRSDAQAAAPLLPQGSIGVTGPNGQGSLLHGGRPRRLGQKDPEGKRPHARPQLLRGAGG